jgi:hypothetical protein
VDKVGLLFQAPFQVLQREIASLPKKKKGAAQDSFLDFKIQEQLLY